MKSLSLLAALMLVASTAFADQHEEKKIKQGHDKEHQHVKGEKADHSHDDAHHKDHDHKAHHPDHDDTMNKAKKK